jgi:Fic family protein
LKLQEKFSGQKVFGRSDVMAVIGIKTSRASELLKELAEYGIIEPVTGHGKGKYRFKQ